MLNDVRGTALYHQALLINEACRQPGTGQISDATEVSASPDGRSAVFAGTIVERLEGTLATRICLMDLENADTKVVTFGPNVDRLPKFSPDGRCIAFLSDRHTAGDFQLYLLNSTTGAARAAPRVKGWVEYLHWSPNGRRILLGVAGHGADVSGAEGARRAKHQDEDLPSWMPVLDSGNQDQSWRRPWIYDVATDSMLEVDVKNINVWEAVWCGNEAIAAVVSPGPGEGLWYSATLATLEIQSGNVRTLYTPQDQLGWPAASPSGRTLAIVEAVCSDRWIVAGRLKVIDTMTAEASDIDTKGVDIACAEWRSEDQLLIAGHRGFEIVVGLCDLRSGVFSEKWASSDISTGGRYVTVSGIGDPGDCILVGESFTRAPEMAVVREGEYRPIKSFDLGYDEQAKSIAAIERVEWQAPDGLKIQGWLLLPTGSGPHPLVMNIHGGPVWQWRPSWLGRNGGVALLLVQRGYAVFYPNPRGSSGRGQAFAREVLAEMGGADTYDYLSGLDHLIAQGIADPDRLGVTGGSYGGFMTSWLITQDARFAAAVAVAPVTNQVTEYLLSNIPHFTQLFLADSYANPGGKFFERSPVMHAHKVNTPTLNICGALDRCTPPEEAAQFHSALLHCGVKSTLLTYPQEGHGIRQFPAAIDYAARLVGWFEEHMPSISD